MPHHDGSAAAILLACSGVALLAAPRLPRAPLLRAVAPSLAPGPADRRAVRGGPADPAWGAAFQAHRLVQEALATLPELRAALAAGPDGGIRYTAVPARLLPALPGSGSARRPAVPGRETGAVAGTAVAHGATLLGLVAESAEGLLWVRLLPDPGCRVAVEVVPPPGEPPGRAGPRPRGVCRGRGAGALVEVVHVPASADVRVGDWVMTSGHAGAVPAGLCVGRVAGVDNADADPCLDVDVEPALEAGAVEAVAYLLAAMGPPSVSR